MPNSGGVALPDKHFGDRSSVHEHVMQRKSGSSSLKLRFIPQLSGQPLRMMYPVSLEFARLRGIARCSTHAFLLYQIAVLVVYFSQQIPPG
jgi:hypothetical protein